MSRILVIDDEVVYLKTVQLALNAGGHEAIIAYGGEDGLRLLDLHYHHIQLILLDMMMPDYSGLEMLKKIQEQKKWVHIPILILSGLGMTPEIEEALLLGASGYLPKPFSRSKLLEHVDIALMV
jgi:DNA-binding response OmpR family regulator